MEFNELREKFNSISYDSFSFKENKDDLEISYFYSLGDYNFIHKINILKKKIFIMRSKFKKTLDNLKNIGYNTNCRILCLTKNGGMYAD